MTSKAETEKRQRWFDSYFEALVKRSIYKPRSKGVLYRCPCCGYQTLTERGGYDICPVCFWEDDGQDDEDADNIRGGPNGALSLTQARTNYREFGACKPDALKHVRKPKPEEM